MGFRKNHFPQPVNDIPVDEQIRGYFSLTSIPDLLQSFNDAAQLAGYREENKNKDLTDMYHAFVELYKKCTGSWRYKNKPFRRTFNPSYDNKQNNSYDYNQNSYGNRQRKSYQPGSYDNNQNSYGNKQKKSYHPGSYNNSYGNNDDQSQGGSNAYGQRGQFNKRFPTNMSQQEPFKTSGFREGGYNRSSTLPQYKQRTVNNN